MTKRQKKGFEIEMPFSPSAFLAGPMKGSFYDDEAKWFFPDSASTSR